MALGIDPQYPDSLYNKGSVSKRFVPSNYRGDSGDIRLEMSCDESPHSGLTIQPLAQVALGGPV
jgi:hypothetical protein